MLSADSSLPPHLLHRGNRPPEKRDLPRRLLRLLTRNPLTRLLRRSLKNYPPVRRLQKRILRERIIAGLRERPAASAWTARAACPLALYDAGGAVIGPRMYLIRGYQHLGAVNDKVFVFDMAADRWSETPAPPARLAHSHAAICSDGARFIYIASGQLGTQCRPAIADSFVFDAALGTWGELPPLPSPRYAGTMQLVRGRLHFVGGALSDRYTPAADHWSLAVEEGRALEETWRDEPPLPLAVMHLGSAAVGEAIYTFGGQQGDFVAIPGDPEYTCNGRTRETFFPDAYRYDPDDTKWTRLRDMPIPASHIDFAVVPANGKIHVFGGQIFKDPASFRLRLSDAIQSYDVAADRWSIGGVYPYRIKTPICAVNGDAIYCATGQRDKNSANDSPGDIVDDTWRIELSNLPQDALEPLAPDTAKPFASLRGKEVVLLSHELTITGAPLILLELACALGDAGAVVRVFSLADDTAPGNIAERHGLPVLPIEKSIEWAARAELVIANTCVAGPWINHFVLRHPSRGSRLIWWIHENTMNPHECGLPCAENVRTMVFDSHSARESWKSHDLGARARLLVLHPGNRDDIRVAAAASRLPWPLAQGVGEVDREQARKLLGVSSEDFLLCCIGTVHARKGQKLLLQTVGDLLARRPDLRVRVLVVGYRNAGQRRRALRSLSSSSRKAVLGGKLLLPQNPEIRAFYMASDAFVMNSQGSGEPFGRVTIEAMAFGLPVLGTSAGGTGEIISDGETGLLHAVGDAGQETLAANILRLAQDRPYARQLGEAGRERAETRFSSSRFLRDMETIVDDMLADARNITASQP